MATQFNDGTDTNVDFDSVRSLQSPAITTAVENIGQAVLDRVKKAGSTMTGALTLSGSPSSANHAATKAYVDSVATGTLADWKDAVAFSTTAALPSCTYSAGVLTGSANGALTAQAGVTPTVAARLLVKNQASGLQNGIYTVTAVGDGSNPFVLTRSTDADATGEITQGTSVLVTAGTTLAGTTWFVTTTGTITIGTTAIAWVQTTASVSLADGAVTTAKLADSAVTSAKIADGTIVSTDLASTLLDTDGTMAANSDTRVPSQQAVREYVASITVTQPPFLVACSDSPQDAKDAAAEVLDGTNDGAQINTLTETLTASRTTPAAVAFTPGTIFLDAAPIYMKTGLTVASMFQNATEVRLVGLTANGAFMLYEGPTHNFVIDGFFINGNFADGTGASSPAMAFYLNHSSGTSGALGTNFLGTAGGNATSVRVTSPDGLSKIANITGGAFSDSGRPTRDFCYINGNSSVEVSRSYMLESWNVVAATGGAAAQQHGINIVNASDGQINNVIMGETNSGNCFNIDAASWRITGSKCYYAQQYGFWCNTNINISGCDAQDCGDDGFHMTGTSALLTGCVADSNGRLVAAAGFRLRANNQVVTGCIAHNKASSTQDYGFEFDSGLTGLYVDGGAYTTTGAAVTGTKPASSTNYVRIMRASAGAASIADDIGTSTNGLWQAGGIYNLDSLSDVQITSPTNGQVVKHNGTLWANGTDAT